MDKPQRISARRLEELARCISERDRSILQALQKCRYLTTAQIKVLHFTDSATHPAALRAANRCLEKLKGYGLIEALKRRIGGVRAGSSAFIWHLTEAGRKLLHSVQKGSAGPNDPPPRKRAFQPSPQFLTHTLAVSEVYVQLHLLGCDKAIELVAAELEPECWRGYNNRDGKLVAVKPDIFAVTAAGEYEDSWFIELDLATEALIRVIEKCQRYHEYHRSGREQKKSGVFPLVVWLVPDTKRKTAMLKAIQTAFERRPHIFVVITPEELEPLIRQGVHGMEGITLC